jgi:hypothetical protein
MKAFFRVFRFAVLIWTLMGICGCATSQPTASQADTGTTANGLGEWMNAIGESLYNSVWVDAAGNPRSH